MPARMLSGTIRPFSYRSAIKDIVGDGNITALWMLDETSGVVAVDAVNGFNGTYINGVLADTATPWGGVAPRITSLLSNPIDIYSARLNAVFDGDEHSLMIWVKMLNAGVWTDNATRFIFLLQAGGDASTFIKVNAANQFAGLRIGGGVQEVVTESGFSTTEWFCAGHSVSRSAGVDGEYKYFRNGVQIGVTQTSLGDYAGNLDPIRTVIGAALSAPPFLVHNGWLAAALITSSILTPAQFEQLYTVGLR